MQHEKAVIKKSVKKYKTVKGVEKESISYNAKIGVDSEFNDGDIVVIIPADEYDEINDIDVGELQRLTDDVADKNETITANNERIAKLNAELKSKYDLINDVTAKLKTSEKTVADLRDSVSEKDKIIVELESKLTVADATITDNEKNIAELNERYDILNESLSASKQYLIDKDNIITDLEKQIAVLNAIDISILQKKADKVDKLKDDLIDAGEKLNAKSNVISLLQNEITEYIQVLNYYKEIASAYKNQSLIHKIIGKDATADITTPTLFLIDLSGNLKKDDNDIEVDATPESENDNNDDSDDDSLTVI